MLLTCTAVRDRQCSNSCISSNYYFNATDLQCYRCSECCGSNSDNIEWHCLTSTSLGIGTKIGEKGSLHCKAPSSQQCDDLQQNVINATPDSNIKPQHLEKNYGCSLDTLLIALICCLAISVTVNFVLFGCCLRGRERQRSSRGCLFDVFRWFPSAGMLTSHY